MMNALNFKTGYFENLIVRDDTGNDTGDDTGLFVCTFDSKVLKRVTYIIILTLNQFDCLIDLAYRVQSLQCNVEGCHFLETHLQKR